MAQDSKIEWCDHSINFWSGCTEVSPACAHCYARAMAKRNKIFGQWGKGAPRSWHGDGAAKEIAKWNKEADQWRMWNGIRYRFAYRSIDPIFGGESIVGYGNPQKETDGWFSMTQDYFDEDHWNSLLRPRPRVFPNSMSDWLDDEVPIEWLAKLLDSIRLAPNLDFLLLTKRPEKWRERMERALCHVEGLDYEDDNWVNSSGPDTELGDFINEWTGDNPPPNVWIGTTAENREWADKRRDHLKAIPAVCHFVSYEPALGPVDWTGWEFLKWLISGGESGGKARPSHPEWHRAASDYAAKHGIAYLFKQWGEWSPRFDTPKRQSFCIVNDGTLYKMTDLAPGGSRRDECFQRGHDKQDRVCIYRVGKAKSGRLLDGVEHNGFPSI